MISRNHFGNRAKDALSYRSQLVCSQIIVSVAPRFRKSPPSTAITNYRQHVGAINLRIATASNECLVDPIKPVLAPFSPSPRGRFIGKRSQHGRFDCEKRKKLFAMETLSDANFETCCTPGYSRPVNRFFSFLLHNF